MTPEPEAFEGQEEITREFVAESLESMEAASQSLAELGRNPDDRVAINDVFRRLHSIKGGAGMLGFGELGEFVHRIENALDAIRKGQQQPTPRHIELLIEATDILTETLRGLGEKKGQNVVGAAHERFLQKVEGSFDGNGHDDAAELPTQVRQWLQRVQAAGALTDAKLAGELETLLTAAAPAAAKTAAAPAPEAAAAARAPEKGKEAPAQPEAEGAAKSAAIGSLRVDLASLEAVINTVGELFYVDERLKHLLEDGVASDNDHGRVDEKLKSIAFDMDSMLTGVYGRLNDIRKIPMFQVTRALERLVRGLSRDQGKRVRFEVVGESMRLDRQLIEAVNDPLVHLIRNSVDHAIEPPEARLAAGKDEEGTIRLVIQEAAEAVTVTIFDDGRGIDGNKIKAKALSRGMIDAARAQAMTEQEAVELIFMPGLSTAEKVTDISGRGVGMDVVISNLKRVDGEVHVESYLGKGTAVALTLPKRDSLLIDGLVMRIGGDFFMLPYKYVKGFLPWQETQTNVMLGRGRIAMLDEGTLPVANTELLTDSAVTVPKEAILLEDRKGRQCALPVDEVVGRKRVLMQDIKREDVFPDLFTGTIILGNGAVAFVVDADSFVGQNVG